MKDDKLYLIHIVESIRRIESYARDGRAQFMRSSLTQDAIIRNFEIIGEAAKQVSPQLKQAHPDVPWRSVAGFRDVLIHQYTGVDLDEVWNIIERALPDLRRQIEHILTGLGGQPRP